MIYYTFHPQTGEFIGEIELADDQPMPPNATMFPPPYKPAWRYGNMWLAFDPNEPEEEGEETEDEARS